jgi:DNA-binding transcriptional LysR family regulator
MAEGCYRKIETMAIKIEMLRCFVTVAELGNLADASERLARTPSAVSMSLKQFEEHLGAPLFESDRKNRLTALGMFTLGEARREVDQFDRCIEAINSFAKARVGIVRLGAVPSVATAILPDIVSEFLAERPDVVIHIRDLDSPSVLREVELGQIDLGIGSTPASRTLLKEVPLFSDEFGVVCAIGHPLAISKRPLSWTDLLPHRLISNATGNQIENPLFRSMNDAAHLQIRNTASILGMVRAGVGITVLPRLVLESSKQGLCFLPLEDAGARRTVSLFSLAQTELSPAARKLQQAIIAGV